VSTKPLAGADGEGPLFGEKTTVGCALMWMESANGRLERPLIPVTTTLMTNVCAVEFDDQFGVP
jgi:hypothetical protein